MQKALRSSRAQTTAYSRGSSIRSAASTSECSGTRNVPRPQRRASASYGDLSSMLADATRPSNIECPRCGYQLDVVANEAERRGETHGACSECGLDIEWRRLRADAVARPWFIEARASRHNIVRRAAGTLVRTARPFQFWSSIDVALPLRSSCRSRDTTVRVWCTRPTWRRAKPTQAGSC